MIKYVFIQNDPMLLPKVLDKYLREFADTTAGVNIQSVSQGKRTVFQTAMDLYRMYGFAYFFWKLRKYVWRKLLGRVVNGWLGSHRTCYSVRAVAEKYGAWVEKNMYGRKYMGILRSAFLIGPTGKIEQAWYKISPKDTPTKLLEALAAA